ncbi:hypothetical protein ACFYSW_25345 [Rhodococcus aetherivorans]
MPIGDDLLRTTLAGIRATTPPLAFAPVPRGPLLRSDIFPIVDK